MLRPQMTEEQNSHQKTPFRCNFLTNNHRVMIFGSIPRFQGMKISNKTLPMSMKVYYIRIYFNTVTITIKRFIVFKYINSMSQQYSSCNQY